MAVGGGHKAGHDPEEERALRAWEAARRRRSRSSAIASKLDYGSFCGVHQNTIRRMTSRGNILITSMTHRHTPGT
jgi:hypothetical protein